MEKKPSQNDTEIHNPEINNTGSNSFEGVPDDVVFVIFPFLRLQDMGNLASVNREFRRIITNAFTNPNMYTAYPGMFEALCKFWHENPVAFQKWFKLYRMPNIEQEEFSSKPYNEACDYIFHALDGYVNRDIRNNALKMVFQNNTDDITQFLLPLVSNASQVALYRRFGNTRLQETLEAQIETWTDTTAASRENIHTLLFCFCLLFSRNIMVFNRKSAVLSTMLDYAEKNMNEIFGQDAIKKYGEGFIKALLQSCRLTLDAANGTKPIAEKINAMRKAFPNVPINLAGANLTRANLNSVNLTSANLTSANLRVADLRGADLMRANFTGADLYVANLTGADLTNANLKGAKLTGAKLMGADLTGLNLTGVNLKGADLTGAKLMRANFTGADLNGANLMGADLHGAKLMRANLMAANLTNAYLYGANLTSVNLKGADLTDLNLTSVNLTNANLTDAKLMGANLSKVNLTGVKLTGADLTNAYLYGANLTGADLTGAKLSYANLTDANLTDAYLTSADLFKCKLSDNTKLEGIKINRTALLSVFIPLINDPKATANIWSFANFWSPSSEMIDKFKLLLPHADIKELEILMEGVRNQISVHPLDFIFGALKKAELLKLISDEIVNKQSQQQKAECEEPTQKESTIGNSQPQNANTIDSTLELPKQSGNTISFNP